MKLRKQKSMLLTWLVERLIRKFLISQGLKDSVVVLEEFLLTETDDGSYLMKANVDLKMSANDLKTIVSKLDFDSTKKTCAIIGR